MPSSLLSARFYPVDHTGQFPGASQVAEAATNNETHTHVSTHTRPELSGKGRRQWVNWGSFGLTWLPQMRKMQQLPRQKRKTLSLLHRGGGGGGPDIRTPWYGAAPPRRAQELHACENRVHESEVGLCQGQVPGRARAGKGAGGRSVWFAAHSKEGSVVWGMPSCMSFLMLELRRTHHLGSIW